MSNANGHGPAKRAVLYARVSGDDRKYATSGIESQLADCRKYAEERGYDIVGERYETPDKATSGAAWLPELEAVLKQAQDGTFDVLVVREIDRLARNRFKHMAIEIELEAHDVKVEYVIGQYDDTAEGRLLKGLMGEFAEYEREKTLQRTQRGKLRSVASGNVTVGGSKAPFGYRLVEKSGKRTLEVHDAEAAVIRTIFDLYANELQNMHDIAHYLDEHNIAQAGRGNNHEAIRRKDRWDPSTVGYMLSNETYVGRWYFRKTKRVKTKDGRKLVKRPKEEWLCVEVPALVSEEIFELVQKRKEGNKRRKRNAKHNTYAMTGIITCGHCGHGISGQTQVRGKNSYQYYYCNARRDPKRYGFKCENPPYRTQDIDGPVWGWVRGTILSPEYLREQWAEHRERRQEELRPLLSMIEANEARRASLQEEKKRLVKAYTAGALTLDDIAAEKTRIEKEIGDVTRALQELQAELEPRWPTEEEMETIERYARRIQLGAEKAGGDPEEKNDLYRMLQMEVTVTAESGDKQWIDLTCILGEARLHTGQNTSWNTQHSYKVQARLLVGGNGGALAGALFTRVGQSAEV